MRSWHVFCFYHFNMQTLTAGPFMLDVDRFLESTAHRSHLTGAAVTAAVRTAHRVWCLRAGFQAFTHGLIVFDHAQCAVVAHLIQTGTWRVEIWKPTTQKTKSYYCETVMGNFKERLENGLGARTGKKKKGDNLDYSDTENCKKWMSGPGERNITTTCYCDASSSCHFFSYVPILMYAKSLRSIFKLASRTTAKTKKKKLPCGTAVMKKPTNNVALPSKHQD